jgi:hypothetical protein
MIIKLGAYNPGAPPKTTPGGLLVYTYGLDEFGKNKIRKACNRMTEAGVEPYIIAEFREWATRLPIELLDWMDAEWRARLAAWRSCVGRSLPNGTRISSGTLNSLAANPPRVVLHPEPFLVPQGVKTAGAAYKNKIEIVIAFLDQKDTWLRRCDHLGAWEFGNLIGINHGFSPQNVGQEIGDKSPC